MKLRLIPLAVAGLGALALAACQEQKTDDPSAADVAAASAAQSAENAADAAGAAATAAAANAGQNTTTVIREVPAPAPTPPPVTKEESTSVTIDGTGATVRNETRGPD